MAVLFPTFVCLILIALRLFLIIIGLGLVTLLGVLVTNFNLSHFLFLDKPFSASANSKDLVYAALFCIWRADYSRSLQDFE